MSHTEGKTRADGIHVYIGDKCVAEMDNASHYVPNKRDAAGGMGCCESQILPDEMAANAKRFSFCWNAHDKLLDACKAIKIRIHFIGWPKEPMNENGTDWSKEIALLEAAIAEATMPQGEKVDSAG